MDSIAESILENLPVGLLIIGGDGTILETTPSACAILGCPIEGFVGNRWGDIFLPQVENKEFTEVVLDAIQKETPKIERITPYHMPDGTKRFLSVISFAHREDGKITAIVVLIEDLTELHELYERERDILQQNHRLASERAESLIHFAGSVAHQIRNPIMAIAGISRLMERREDESLKEPLEAIKDETEKLETMVRAVAEYSSITMSSVAPVNLWVIIEEAKHRIEDHPEVQGKDIKWKTECPDMNIMVDRFLLAQALSELLLNGAEFGGPGTTVSLCASESNGHITLNIRDDGPGFTEEGLDMGFDPFYTTKPVGAGMGLTRVKRIVGEHSGTVALHNGHGGGHVSITIPSDPLWR